MARVFCGYGGIGRRAGLRIQWGNPCRFKSCYPHDEKWPFGHFLIKDMHTDQTLVISVSCTCSKDVSSQEAQSSVQRAASGFGFRDASRQFGSFR